MGGGTWTHHAFNTYTKATRGVDAKTYATSSAGAQEVFRSRGLDAALNPMGVMRECADSAEHPNTFPVILALDVTGSMGAAAAKVAKALGEIMGSLYAEKEVPDVEFCIMAIGDLYCDSAPIQISQFESDIRIAEQLDKVFFEYGGGGNKWESYTAAWYMGSRHCKLDCWARGQKGVIITLGDEQLNPVLQAGELHMVVGDSVQADINTEDMHKEACEKFDIYHISVSDAASSYSRNNHSGAVDDSWKRVLGQNYRVCTINDLAHTITDIVKGSFDGSAASGEAEAVRAGDGIRW